MIAATVAASELFHAIAAEIPESLPDSIQWMPPGKHQGVASRAGKPHKFEVTIDQDQAQRVQNDFIKIKAKADTGQEDRPYFDLNHDDREASAHPTEYFWGGDDPMDGGIRAKVEWTGAGSQAVKGKTYRRFSPSFFLNNAGEISLIHPSGEMAVNQGGLVNRAAFKRIAPIWSKDAEGQSGSGSPNDPAAQQQQQEEEQPTMKSLLSVLAAQGLLKSADVDEATAVTQVAAALSQRATDAAQKDNELTQLKTKSSAVEQKYTQLLTAHATSIVDAAIQAGRLPGKNDELKAKWVGLIQADPTNASLLPEPNAALTRLVKAGAGQGAGDGVDQKNPFMAKVAEYQGEKKCSEAFAVEAVAHANPKLYDEYRATLNLGVPVTAKSA